MREVLKSVRMTAVEEGFRELAAVPDNFRYFHYNNAINGQRRNGGDALRHQSRHFRVRKDYRIENAQHPVPALAKRTKDNTDVGRVKDA